MVSVSGEPKWYAIQTLANKEDSVKRYLDRYLKSEEMEEFILQVLTPTETVTEVKNGRKSVKKRKFYPNYVFIQANLFDENNQLITKPWHYIKDADGVIGFLGGDKPVALKKSDIDAIIKRVSEAEGKETPKVSFEVGEEVKITDGPFLNLSGRIDEIDAERGRLKVSVSIFGRFTPVELEFWQVQRNTES